MNYTIFVILGILAVSILSVSSIASAETSAKSSAFEKTTLLEFTNNDSTPIQSVKMWLKDGMSFQSFKTEKGWTGSKTPQGVLIFTSAEPLSTGQSVKFGIKTDIESPGVSWRTIDSIGNEISTGKVLPSQANTPKPADQTPKSDNTTPPQNTPKQSNFDSAVFKIIPESPKNGDDIRIIGEGFPPNTYLDFLINDNKVQDFKTDDSGHMVGRTKVPITLEPGRIDLSLADSQNHKKTISIRIAPAEQVIQQTTKRLTIDQINGLAEPGQKISINGTDAPGKSVKITAKDPAGNKIYEAVVQVDNQGNWSHQTTIPLDAPLGTRQVDISDGVDTITKTISVSVSKTIKLIPSFTKYNLGDKFVFNGTAKAGQSLQITINDPIGKEIFSDIITPDDSGSFTFEYPTTQSSPKGTYAVFATQGEATEIVRVGLGELPSPQIIAKLDKLNYVSSDASAKITIQGQPKSTVTILVVDPSDKVKTTETVTLDLDGTKIHELNLSGYKSGVYTIVVKQTQSQTKLVFSVGLQTTTNAIVAQTTKAEYLPGEGILLLGTSDPNTILNIEMSDPDGTIIKRKDIFSDKTGKFSDGTFRVPTDAKQGPWLIKVKSGPKFTDSKFTVTGTKEKTFAIKLDKSTPYIKGDHMDISGTGGGKSQTVIIKILDSNSAKITELQVRTTKDGSFDTIWTVQSDLVAGKYTIQVTVGVDTTETTFDLQ